jgi:hypothetical protein
MNGYTLFPLDCPALSQEGHRTLASHIPADGFADSDLIYAFSVPGSARFAILWVIGSRERRVSDALASHLSSLADLGAGRPGSRESSGVMVMGRNPH